MKENEIIRALELLTVIACCEIEKKDSSLKYSDEINKIVRNMPNNISETFTDCYITISRCVELNKK